LVRRVASSPSDSNERRRKFEGFSVRGRRIAAIGIGVVVAVAASAVWILEPREPSPLPLRPPPPAATAPIDPPIELPKPVAARRLKKPPEPYLPPYEKAPSLLAGLVHPVRGEETPKWPKLYGRVISDVDQAPLRDAVIGVAAEFASGREFHETILLVDDVRAVARTDGDGRFELGEAVPGAVFTASAKGAGPVLFDRDWLARTPEAPFVIQLAPAATLKARITDRIGAPKSGVEIRLIANAYEAAHRNDLFDDRIIRLLVGARRVTDEHGEAVFTGLPSGVPFDAELWTEQRLILRDPPPTVFEPGKESAKEWRLGSGCTVSGRVVDDAEKPVSGQTLWLTQQGVFASHSDLRASLDWGNEDRASHLATTDGDGRFWIEDVSPGRWWLGVAPQPFRWSHSDPIDVEAIAPVAEAFQVDADRRTLEIVLRVHRGLFIRGRTVDPDGNPVLAGISAMSTASGSNFEAFGSADSETGEFEIGPLEPGEYRLHATPYPVSELRARRGEPGTPLAPNESLTVLAGSVDVVISFEPGGSIRAKARRADTGADVPARFQLAPTEHPERCHYMGVGGPIDSAHFMSLTPGSYFVSAVTPDGRVGCVRDLLLGAGQRMNDVDVRVEPGAHLKLRYVGTNDEFAQVTILSGGVVFGGDGIEKGTTSTFVAPAGKVKVRWQAGSEHLEEEVDLEVGETRELVWPRPK
jgi:hypothetical protein